jgi:hypothetical protein
MEEEAWIRHEMDIAESAFLNKPDPLVYMVSVDWNNIVNDYFYAHICVTVNSARRYNISYSSYSTYHQYDYRNKT